MSGILQLAYRYIVSQKKRSLLTIIGIALPIMLVVIVGQTFASIKATQLYEVEESVGAYHFFYNITSLDQGQQIMKFLGKNSDIEKCGISTNLGVSMLKDGRKISCIGLDDVSTQLKSIVLKSGRFPQKSNEACIEEWIIPSMNTKPEIGKEFELQITDSSGKKSNERFILSGILKDTPYKAESDGYGALLCIKNQAVVNIMMNKNISSQVYVKFKYDGSYNGFKTILNKAFKYGELPAFSNAKINVNNNYYSKLMNSNDNTVQLYLIAIILLAATLMIYNTFSITVSERIHQYGLLRCIGISGVQLFITVITEAILLGIASIILGLLLGYGMTFLVVKHLILQLHASKIIVQVNTGVMIIATIVGFITVLVSACVPAYRTYRISPITASKASGIESNHSRKNSILEKVTRNYFSTTVNLAVCNLKRYKGKRLITLLSLIISTTVFMVLLYFNFNYMSNSSKIQNSYTGDFSVWVNSQSKNKFNDQDLKKIQNIKGVKSIHGYNKSQNMIISFKIDKNDNIISYKIDPYLQSMKYFYPKMKSQDSELEKGILQVPITIYGCDEFLFENKRIILKSGKINLEKLKSGENVLIEIPDDILPIGKSIDILSAINQGGEAPKKVYSSNIGGIIAGFPGGIDEVNKNIMVYVYKDVFDKITQSKEYAQVFIEAEKGADYTAALKQLKQITSAKIGMHYDNYIEQRKIMKNSFDKYATVLFAMIFMVLLVSSINVFNTLYSNLLQRTNELGMIRAVGMSKKEMKNMFLFESLYYGIISSLVSIILTIVLNLLIFSHDPHESIISILRVTPWVAYFFTAVGNTLLCVGVMHLSALRTYKMSVVEAIGVVE